LLYELLPLSFRFLFFSLHNAKITTIGSRVEDMFYITNADQQPITELQQLDELRLALLKQLAAI